MSIDKLKNSTKSNTMAIANAIDLSIGGFISQAKTNILNVYKGYMEEKISNLILDLQANDISEKEIIEHIENMSSYDKDIVFTIIQKTINSEHKIKRFLLSKVWLFKMQHAKLDYFHATLLSSLELFSANDFHIVYKISKVGIKKDTHIKVDIRKLENYYASTVQKLKSIGFINGSVLDGGSFDKNEDNFYVFEYYFELERVLIEFYERAENDPNH